MKKNCSVDLELMQPDDTDAAVNIISIAMNPDEAKWAKETFDFYFACDRHGMNSGREYYVCKKDNKVIGLVGLHHYIWGPRENVWLSWFAVLPSYQGRGIGTAMLEAIEQKAHEKGYRKFFIETYDGPIFEKARAFYQSRGFVESGRISDYLPGKESMRVFKKDI